MSVRNSRTYSDLLQFDTLEERFEYLRLDGRVGERTFGHERFINQRFYRSLDWSRIRDLVAIRDNGCDLGVPGHDIHGKALIHHMNPMRPEDIIDFKEENLDPEFLITVSHRTHNAIHYGDEKHLPRPFVERSAGDTLLWGRRS